MPFFTYSQNNSGGSFVTNDRVCQYVIVEANNVAEADTVAEGLGVYFDGVETGVDCDHCGNRWWPADGRGTEKPEIYGENPAEHVAMFVGKGEVYARVFCESGRVVAYRKK